MFSIDDLTQIHCDLGIPVPCYPYPNGIGTDDDEKVHFVLYM